MCEYITTTRICTVADCLQFAGAVRGRVLLSSGGARELHWLSDSQLLDSRWRGACATEICVLSPTFTYDLGRRVFVAHLIGPILIFYDIYRVPIGSYIYIFYIALFSFCICPGIFIFILIYTSISMHLCVMVIQY